jgi:inorganic phosphate transporter, PiT family
LRGYPVLAKGQGKRAFQAGSRGAWQLQKESQQKLIPDWVKVSVAGARGLGTMIGWKRIVVTVGEKIGKQRMTYARAPPPTVLACQSRRRMCAFLGCHGHDGRNDSGVQMSTLRSIALAWVLALLCAIGLATEDHTSKLFVRSG